MTDECGAELSSLPYLTPRDNQLNPAPSELRAGRFAKEEIKVRLQSPEIGLVRVPTRRVYELLPCEFYAVAFRGLMASSETRRARVVR